MRKQIMISIFAIFFVACSSSEGYLTDSGTILYYHNEAEKVKLFEQGQELTDKFVNQLEKEVDLFVTKADKGVMSAYTAGQYAQVKKDWSDYIDLMKISHDEKLDLIKYYRGKVTNIIIEP